MLQADYIIGIHCLFAAILSTEVVIFFCMFRIVQKMKTAQYVNMKMRNSKEYKFQI